MVPTLAAIAAFSLIILVHELGHFWAAKLCGVTVLKFSIGLGKPLFRWGRGITEYQFCPVLVGGYVRLIGQKDAEMMCENKAEYLAHGMPEELFNRMVDPRGWIANKSGWQQMLVCVSGVLFNVALAFLAFTALYFVSSVWPAPGQVVVSKVFPESPAAEAGIREGDVILELQGAELGSSAEMAAKVAKSKGAPVELLISREKKTLKLSVRPKKSGEPPTFRLGVQLAEYSFGAADPSFIGGLHYGAQMTGFSLGMSASGIAGLLVGKNSIRELSGPIGIVDAGGKMLHNGPAGLLFFVGILSCGLAVINMFPIPVTDGGQMIFALWKVVRGREFPEKARMAMSLAAALFLTALLVLVTIKDICNL